MTTHYTRNSPEGNSLYGRRWRKIRRAELKLYPFCETPNCLRPATVRDHIKPHRGDKKLFYDPTNRQSLCKPCHDEKTRLEDAPEVFKARGWIRRPSEAEDVAQSVIGVVGVLKQ
jgi:5-methylcytosine-specific restriction endonuclease McrA